MLRLETKTPRLSNAYVCVLHRYKRQVCVLRAENTLCTKCILGWPALYRPPGSITTSCGEMTHRLLSTFLLKAVMANPEKPPTGLG